MVVIAVNHDLVALALGHLEHQRDQVCLRLVVFAEIGGGAGGVKVTQCRIFDPVDFVVPAQDFFKTEFGFAVGIDRNLRGGFANRVFIRLPESRGGAGENNHFDAAFNRGVGQVDAVGQIVAEIFAGVLHGFADQRERGEMHDGVEFLLTAQLDDQIAVGQIAFDEIGAGIHRFFVSGYKRVEYHNLMFVVK